MTTKVRKLETRTAPPRLDTPTDLSAEGVREISAALNALIADTFALYVKTKNFHWHVSGPHFRDYHLLLDEQGDQLAASIDILAERARKIGGTGRSARSRSCSESRTTTRTTFPPSTCCWSS